MDLSRPVGKRSPTVGQSGPDAGLVDAALSNISPRICYCGGGLLGEHLTADEVQNAPSFATALTTRGKTL